MNLLICMAGLNTRFHNVGFDIPKYLLPWNNSVVIFDILKNLTADNVYLIAHQRDKYYKKELIKAINPLGLTTKNLQRISIFFMGTQ
jgi:dTDP-glucose pyrophosphorylase